MKNSNYFKDSLESILDQRKIVFLIFLIQNVKKFLKEIGFSKNDINFVNLEFKNILIEEHEEYLDYVKNIEEPAIEKFLNK